MPCCGVFTRLPDFQDVWLRFSLFCPSFFVRVNFFKTEAISMCLLKILGAKSLFCYINITVT